MKRSAGDLARIAVAGGGFTIDAKNYTVEELARIAVAANNHKPRIHITNAHTLSTNDIARIAVAGKGAVSFDL